MVQAASYRNSSLRPWSSLYDKLFDAPMADSMLGQSPPFLMLCNTEESNCFEPILWLHACLSADASVDVLQTLRNVYAYGRGKPIVGLAMYELHAVDNMVPTDEAELQKKLADRRAARQATVRDAAAQTFAIDSAALRVR